MGSARLVVRQPQSTFHDSDLPPVANRVLANRGVTNSLELDLSLKQLLSPTKLPNLSAAVNRLVRAVCGGERILFVGDFDADGATSVALGVLVLRAFGVEDVRFVVPNRFDFGYGLSPEIVAVAAEQQPDLIITVDNGIASVAGVARANELGIDVIITDHHLPGEELPAACAIVNPQLAGAEFGSKNLAGVGVIYYVLAATRAALAEQGWFSAEAREMPNLADYLDLVALGTVADVVPLDHNNRVLVQQGLLRMRAGRTRPGIRALVEIGKRDLGRLQAADLGFAVGPRLNAAGRLNDMTIGIRCLLAETDAEARRLGIALDQLNVARRELEQTMTADAELIVREQLDRQDERLGVCVYDPSWHQGVVGIVAGRMKERLHRPVIAFAEAGGSAPDEIKGSARSVEGLHIRDLLDAIATAYPGLLLKFGGHAMAAGLSLKRVHYQRFSRIFDRNVGQVLPEEAREAVLFTDGELSVDELTLSMVSHIEQIGPWGQAFPEPLFCGVFECVTQRVVGGEHLRLTLRESAKGKLYEAIAFRQPPLFDPAGRAVEVAYRLARNDYGGVDTLQLIVEQIGFLETT